MIIVDDEPIFRDFLKSAIDWEAYNYKIIAEARNGAEALKLAIELEPDVALVDINMPQMDGITFAEKLKEQNLSTSVVLITGHSEFEYARKAVKLGVEDYILKPFEKEELILTLLRLDKKAKNGQLAMKSDNISYHRDNFLRYLVSEEYNNRDDETYRELDSLGITLTTNTYQLIGIEIDRMEQKWEIASERRLWKFAVGNILQDVLFERNPVLFNGEEGRIVCMLQGQSDQERKFIEEELSRLCELIKKYLKFTITIGVGRVHNGLAGIRISYQEALESLRAKFVVGNDRVLTYDRIQYDSKATNLYTAAMNEDFMLQLRLHNWQSIKATIDHIFGQIRSDRLSVDYAYMICMGLASHCFTYVASLGKQVEDVYGKSIYPYAEIQQMETVEEVYEWIIQLYSTAVTYAMSLNLSRSSKLAAAARAYIDEQYSDAELGVEQIAQHVYVNSSYMRSVFKKEFGMTITDYVIQIRLSKAKELLADGSRRLSDIAFHVGFNDPGYFSKCFKKHFGMSPSEYGMLSQ